MENQITTNSNALKLFFTEDVFLVPDDSVVLAVDNEINSNKVIGNSVSAIAEDYKIPEVVSIAQEPTKEIVFDFLGGNAKAVLILVNDTKFPVSSAEGRELLRKIVKAVNLSTPDFALVNYSKYNNVDFGAFKAFFKPSIMLAFGVTTEQLKLNISYTGNIIDYENTKMIFAPNLHPLDADIAEKKNLWANLQKL